MLDKKAQCLALIHDMFQRQQLGSDIAPAAKFRLEGQLQLLLDCELMSWQEYVSHCESAMRDYDLSLPSKSYWQWCYNAGDIYIRIPLTQKEAPVYK